MSGRRVVVTGLGAVSPLGADVAGFWQALVDGRNGIGPLTKLDPEEAGVSIAAEVHAFDSAAYVDGRTARLVDPTAVLFLAAAEEALADASLSEPADPGAVAVIAGVDSAMEAAGRTAVGLHTAGQLGVDAYALVQGLPNTATGLVSRRFGLRGPHFAISAACAGGAVALLHAANLIRLGDVDAAVAGAALVLDRSLVAACLSARVLSRCPDPARASRPFDRDRDGFVLSEGSAALVLEELGHARRRGAPAYAELLGGCQTSSIAGFTVNDADDCAACIRRALARAGVEPDGIDLVSAHAPSTPLGDRQEAEALNAVFNGRRVPVFAAKSSLGHSMAATAALESIASVLAIRDGVAPPTLHYEVPDPECDVDCIPGSARRLPVRRVLKNAFGFGGVNCSLVFGAPADA